MSAWLARQQAKLLPVGYFMVTFTLPAGLRPIALRHQRVVYDALFASAADTLKCFGANHRQLHADLGFCAVLHTHNRRLDYHPHLLVVIPGGGIDAARKQWRKLTGRYLFNGRQLGTGFRRVRDYGFLHANAKRLLTLLQIVLRVIIPPTSMRAARPFTCPLCHAPMVVRAFIAPSVRVT